MISQKGVVKKGQGYARQLGFRTLNIDNTLQVDSGIYAGKVTYRGQVFDAVIYVGNKSKDILEAHLFGFGDEIYGAEVVVEVIYKLREDKEVFDMEELRKLIAEDCKMAQAFLNHRVV